MPRESHLRVDSGVDIGVDAGALKPVAESQWNGIIDHHKPYSKLEDSPMPFTQISLRKGKPLDYRRKLMEEVYLAMRESIDTPENDRFATVTEFEDGNFDNSADYLGISRSDDIVYIRITLNRGRTTDKKKALYAKIGERLNANLGVRTEDIVICLVEVSPEDWSLGNGVAQYA